jgi:hypothetical protein
MTIQGLEMDRSSFLREAASFNKNTKSFTGTLLLTLQHPLCMRQRKKENMNNIPILNDKEKRKISIVNNTPAIFEIKENPAAISKAPFYEWEEQSEVSKWCGLIISISVKNKVDPDLVMAILYMETTHGWYDRIYPFRSSILPMNINFKYWRDLGVTKEILGCPYYNIEYGVMLISRIKERIENPTVEKIATIYNFLGAETVTDYGARVHSIYTKKPWIKKGCSA